MFEVFGHRVSGLGVRYFCLRLGFGGAEFAVIGKQGGSTQWVFGMQAFVVRTLAGSGGPYVHPRFAVSMPKRVSLISLSPQQHLMSVGVYMGYRYPYFCLCAF